MSKMTDTGQNPQNPRKNARKNPRKSNVPAPDEIWNILREVSLSQKETDRMLQASRKEFDRRMRETDRQINKLDGKYGNLWGDLAEALIQGNLIDILKKEGLDAGRIFPNYKGRSKDQKREFDLIALNGREIVVVEAKSSLDQKKADRFLKVMARFKEYCPEFSSLTVHAGMACLRATDKVIKYVIDKGMFMILVQGENAVLLNPKGSERRAF